MINVLTESSLQKDSGNIKGVANSLQKARNGLTITKEAIQKAVGTKVPLLLNHKWDTNPIGEVNIESIDDDGLHYTGSIFKAAPDRDLLLEGIQTGVQSVSVGLRVLKHEGTKITDAELLELSLTPVPADANATVEAFKLNTNNDNKQTENNNNNNQEQQTTTTLTDVVNAINDLTSAVKSLKTNDNNSNSQSSDNNSDQLKEALSKTLSVYGNTFNYHDYREIKNLLNKSEGEN